MGPRLLRAQPSSLCSFSRNIPASTGCLHVANSTLLPGYDLWRPSFSTQPLPGPAHKHLLPGSVGHSVLPSRSWLLHSPLKLCTCPLRGPFLLHSPLPGAQVLLTLLSLSLFFHPNRLCGGFLALSEVWGLLPVFSRYSVQTVPCVSVFWTICGRGWEPCPAPLPSGLPVKLSLKHYFSFLIPCFFPLNMFPTGFYWDATNVQYTPLCHGGPLPWWWTEAEPRFEGLKTGDQSWRRHKQWNKEAWKLKTGTG